MARCVVSPRKPRRAVTVTGPGSRPAVSADRDGTFRVTNPRNGFSKTYYRRDN